MIGLKVEGALIVSERILAGGIDDVFELGVDFGKRVVSIDEFLRLFDVERNQCAEIGGFGAECRGFACWRTRAHATASA